MTAPRAFLTGATGFIGSRLAHRLVQEGVEVHALCRPQAGRARHRSLLSAVHWHEGDLRDADGLRRILAAVSPEWVFHLAAPPFSAAGPQDTGELLTVAVQGTANLLAASRELAHRAWIHTGDAFEHGPGPAPHREADPWRPDTAYGIARLAGTLHALAEATQGGRPVTVLRLFSTYGPGDHPERLIARLVAAARRGGVVDLSHPLVTRDWVHVDDVVEAYLAAARAGEGAAGRLFNIGSGRSASVGELVELVSQLSGGKLGVRWGAFPVVPQDRSEWVADIGQAGTGLGWRPRIGLEHGLHALLAGET